MARDGSKFKKGKTTEIRLPITNFWEVERIEQIFGEFLQSKTREITGVRKLKGCCLILKAEPHRTPPKE